MTPLVAKLALDWVAAERADAARRGEPMDPIPKADELAIASDRVYAVMSGEVPWSQCSAGDRAIWRGRFRDVGLFESIWNEDDKSWLQRVAGDDARPSRRRPPRIVGGGTAAGAGAVRPNYPGPTYPAQPQGNMALPEGGWAQPPVQAQPAPLTVPRLNEVLSRRDQVFYDTLTAADIIEWSSPRIRMFNSRHVGQQHLTNLQVPGQLWSDATVYILGIWIWPSTMEGLLHIANRWMFTLGMGDMPAFGPIHARELFQGYVFQRPIVVPVRQNIFVEVGRGGDRLTNANEPVGDLWDVTFCMQTVVEIRRRR